MMINSFNEWDRLREITVGTATLANWSTHDPVFAQEYLFTSYLDSPVPAGPVPQWIIDETNEDLDGLVKILETAGVKVRRPSIIDWQARDGMSSYCPRDRILVAGNVIVDVAMMYPCRDAEIYALEWLVGHDHRYVTMPRDQGLVCDAANICRLGEHWLFLESRSGNRAAYEWLCVQFPEIHIELCNFYAGVHIDSTILPLREGTVVLNADRVNEDNCPRVFKKWQKIYVSDVVAQGFYQYPYASKWIALNMLSIDPDTVIVDAAQHALIEILEKYGFNVIPHTLRHSRTLGGGFHCVTLDTWRQA